MNIHSPTSARKESKWLCDACDRTLMHGEFRYNCTVCYDYDQCEQCAATSSPCHPHQMVRELAYSYVDNTNCVPMDMITDIQSAMTMYWDRHCMGVRDIDRNNPKQYLDSYSWWTFQIIGDRSKNFGHGLRRLVQPRGYLVICAASRPEWLITDFACMLQSIISVPIYCHFNDRDVVHILKDISASIVVCDGEMLPKFIRLYSQCPALQHIVCMDPISETTTGKDQISIHSMADIERDGSLKHYTPVLTSPDDCFSIIYTSGSSGFPKGAILSNAAFWASFPSRDSLTDRECVSLSYAPLAWSSGRKNVIQTFLYGGRTGFSTGDPSRLMEEMALVRPTAFGGPPTIWNKIYSEFKAALSLVPPEARTAEEVRLMQRFSELIPNRCRFITIGGAMVSPMILDFMRRCFSSCMIHETYGITECGTVAFANVLDNTCDYRLESVPEMHCTVNDQPFPRGELLIKTGCMFSGYVNNLDESKAALSHDGFFRTGDIVELRRTQRGNPCVHVIARKKSFFKLSQGQFVSPEFLEGIYLQSPFVQQIYVHGDLLSDSVTAVIVPIRQHMQMYAVESLENRVTMNNPASKFYQAVMQDLGSIAAKESLRKHEIPSRLLFDLQPFTSENGLLTSTMKPCRPKLAARYAEQLQTSHSMSERLKTMIETATGRSLSIGETEDLMATGGDSLAAVRLSRLIEDELAVSVPVNILFRPDMNVQRLATLVQDPAQLSSLPQSIVPQMLRDSQMDLGVTIGESRPTGTSPSMVLVTGATGYVGAFLLAELLTVYPPQCRFACLVRCKPLSNPLDRIRDNMSFLHVWKDDYRERIVALRGDLSKDRMGLDEETYESLAVQTDIIFHCGAIVNFMLPYNKLYGPNVCGTREIIRLAAHGSTCIPVQYISTVSVLPPGVVDELPIDEISPHGLTTGYAQSKWVAEKLMAKGVRLGLPVIVYRLGSIGGHTKTGACNRNDLHTLVIAAMIRLGCYPTVATNSSVDGLPVDFTAKSIVYLSRAQPGLYGNIYHVSNPYGGVPFRDILLNMQKCGLALNGVSFDEWQSQMKGESIRNSPLEPLGELLSANLFNRRRVVSSERFCNAVVQLVFPSLNNEYIFKWVSFIFRHIVNNQ